MESVKRKRSRENFRMGKKISLPNKMQILEANFYFVFFSISRIGFHTRNYDMEENREIFTLD